MNVSVEANASITVKRSGVVIGTGSSTTAGTYAVTLNAAVIAGDILNVTAIAAGKSISPVNSITVLAAGAAGGGAVVIVNPDGSTETVPFQNTLTTSTTDPVTITSSVGVVEATTDINISVGGPITVQDGVEFNVTGNNNISLVAAEDITLGEDVSFTTNGNSAIDLVSSGGNIILRNANLVSSGSSSHVDVVINANKDVDISGATIEAERDVLITAGRDIYAQNTIINSLHSGSVISFTLNPTGGSILVTGLNLNKNGTATGRVCGTLAQSDTINNIHTHNACSPSPAPTPTPSP